MKKVDILEGGVYKNLLSLGIPIAVGSIVQTLYNLADTFWLGKLGREALSAPIISFNLTFFILSFGIGFSMAGASLSAQYLGTNNLESAKRAAGNALVLLQVMGFIFTFFAFFWSEEMLKLLSTPIDTFKQTLSYFKIIILGIPFALPFFIFYSVMTSYGNVKTPLIIEVVTAIFNAIIDPLLIFGFGIIPPLGVEGAAYATIITRGIASIWGLYLFFIGNKEFRLKLSDLLMRWEIVKKLFKVGIPAALGMSGTSLGFLVLMGLVNQLGTVVVSAYGIGNRVIHFFMMPAQGISSAVSAMVGQALGAGNIKRARETIRKGVFLNLLLIVPFMVLLSFVGGFVSSIFIQDEAVQKVCSLMFMIISTGIIFFSLQTVYNGVFQGSGRTMPIMISNIARLWVFRIPVAYFFVIYFFRGEGIFLRSKGIWFAILISNFFSYVLIKYFYGKNIWCKGVIHDN